MKITPQYPDKAGEEGLTIVQKLSLRIKDVADAYDLEYDGEEGERWKATSEAGIALDDFVMVNGHELVKALTSTVEPVAWVNGDELRRLANPVIATYERTVWPSHYDTPLYSAPKDEPVKLLKDLRYEFSRLLAGAPVDRARIALLIDRINEEPCCKLPEPLA